MPGAVLRLVSGERSGWRGEWAERLKTKPRRAGQEETVKPTHTHITSEKLAGDQKSSLQSAASNR